MEAKSMIKDEFVHDATSLNSLLIELDLCQKEKMDILKWIEYLKKHNILAEKKEDVRIRMTKNLKRFEEVVNKIKSIQKKIKEPLMRSFYAIMSCVALSTFAFSTNCLSGSSFERIMIFVSVILSGKGFCIIHSINS